MYIKCDVFNTSVRGLHTRVNWADIVNSQPGTELPSLFRQFKFVQALIYPSFVLRIVLLRSSVYSTSLYNRYYLCWVSNIGQRRWLEKFLGNNRRITWLFPELFRVYQRSRIIQSAQKTVRANVL